MTATEQPSRMLRVERLDSPVAHRLVAEVQQEYVQRYGGQDSTVLTAEEFAPPSGLFLVAELDGVPVGAGGYRSLGDGVVELKRMYTAASARRRGVGRAVLAALEEAARDAGFRRVVLGTGTRQPEALAMYVAAGYVPTTPFGTHACQPEARHLSKDL